MCIRGVSLEIVADSRKNLVQAVKPGMNDQRGGDAIACGHPCKNESLLNVLGIPSPCADAGGLLRGVIKEPAHLLSVQVRRATRCGRRSENAGNSVGALVAVVSEVERTETDSHTRPDIVAERYGAQKTRSVDAKLFPGRQGCGNDRAARMRLRELVGVVGLIGMR